MSVRAVGDEVAALRRDLDAAHSHLMRFLSEQQRTMHERIDALQRTFEECAGPLLATRDASSFFSALVTLDRILAVVAPPGDATSYRQFLDSHGGCDPVSSVGVASSRAGPCIALDRLRQPEVRVETQSAVRYSPSGRPIVAFNDKSQPSAGLPADELYVVQFARGVVGVAAGTPRFGVGTHVVCDPLDRDETGFDIGVVVASVRHDATATLPGTRVDPTRIHAAKLVPQRAATAEEVADWTLQLEQVETHSVDIANAAFLKGGAKLLAVEAHCRSDRRLLTIFVVNAGAAVDGRPLAEALSSQLQTRVVLTALDRTAAPFTA